MVIEHFRNDDPKPVAERFARDGRMLPDGVIYEASWIDPSEMRCFQLMTAPDRASLEEWIARWNDIVDFEIVEVVDPTAFWSQQAKSR